MWKQDCEGAIEELLWAASRPFNLIDVVAGSMFKPLRGDARSDGLLGRLWLAGLERVGFSVLTACKLAS